MGGTDGRSVDGDIDGWIIGKIEGAANGDLDGDFEGSVHYGSYSEFVFIGYQNANNGKIHTLCGLSSP